MLGIGILRGSNFVFLICGGQASQVSGGLGVFIVALASGERLEIERIIFLQ